VNREQKAQMITELHDRFTTGTFVALTEFKGSTVGQMDAIRRSCEPAGLYFRVVKNTLAVRALEGTGKEKLAAQFVGNVGLIVTGDDPVAAAKFVKKYAKEHENIKVKAGFFDGDVLDAKGVDVVAELPSKPELQSMLLATIQAGPRDLLGVLQAAPRDLVYLLANFADKLEKAG
jgi:large subunit ribosomal protein L10